MSVKPRHILPLNKKQKPSIWSSNQENPMPKSLGKWALVNRHSIDGSVTLASGQGQFDDKK